MLWRPRLYLSQGNHVRTLTTTMTNIDSSIARLEDEVRMQDEEIAGSHWVQEYRNYCIAEFKALRSFLDRELRILGPAKHDLEGTIGRFELSVAGAFGFWVTIGLLITWAPLARNPIQQNS